MRQLILLTLFTLQMLNLAYGRPECDCDYHRGGCAISDPAPQGFKCKCRYKGLWTCSGTAFVCNNGENCAAGRSDYCACELGGGDCGGYRYKPDDCSSENKGNSTNTNTNGADCDCDYHSGGCLISEAAPKDYNCVCVYKGALTCGGWAEGCSANEYCPGGDYSYCGCKQGGGDCGAYPDASTDPNGDNCTHINPIDCDCNRNSDWGKSMYDVIGVEYEMNKMVRSNIRPQAIGTHVVINHSDATQSIVFGVSKSLSSTSSFTHTTGISISVGVSFTSKFPIIDTSGSITVESSTSYTWGDSKKVALEFSSQFKCNGPPMQKTRCEVSLQRADVSIPYIMTLNHKEIKNCYCESKGIWRGLEAYNASLEAYKIEIYHTTTYNEGRTLINDNSAHIS